MAKQHNLESTLRGLYSLVAISLITAIYLPSASAAIQVPKCESIVQWATVAYEKDKNVRQGNFMGGKYNGKYLLYGLMDEMFKPTFNATFNELSKQDISELQPILKDCYIRAKKTAWSASKKNNYDAVNVFNGAVGFIDMLGVTTSAGRVDSFPEFMDHQQEVYVGFNKALSVKDAQLKEANEMAPTKANILKLTTMANHPQFAYLRPIDKKNHGIILHNEGVRLADKMVETAMEKFSGFPETLQGLHSLKSYYRKMQTELSGIKSTKWRLYERTYETRILSIATNVIGEAIPNLNAFSKDLSGLRKLINYRNEMAGSIGTVKGAPWPDFENAYVKVINDTAVTALDGFRSELAKLPATKENLQVVNQSVNTLFEYLPVPANVNSYRDVASERAKAMNQSITKLACYKSLDRVGLEKGDRETAILGYNGETTLGLFVCAVAKGGYKFQEYETSGWISTTHSLRVLTPRGITLTIEMEMIEAVKNREMLVGVVAKDASSETALTLPGWQDYAQKLTRGGI